MTAPPLRRPRVFLRSGGDKRLVQGHPWVYSNEIRMDGDTKELPAGSPVSLHRVDGKPLGAGTFNPHCLIAFRLFTPDAKAAIDRAFFAARMERALALRQVLFAAPYYRMIHAEADGLPGLVVDRFADVLAVQTGTAGMEARLEDILAVLDDICAPAVVVLRNDSRGRALEGLAPYVRLARGELDGPVEVREGGMSFLADPLKGQKTGWFFDQRDNRAFVAGLAAGGRMMDAYCHSGGFAIAAAAAGATEVMAMDSSEPALALARRAAEMNGVEGRCRFLRAEVFGELERLAADGERFRLLTADPPAFVTSRKDLKPGLKGYRKLARLAAALVEPGGFLSLASCSHNVEAAAFAAEVSRGIAGAGRTGRILRSAGAAPDHPVHPHLPESAYLKSLVLQLD